MNLLRSFLAASVVAVAGAADAASDAEISNWVGELVGATLVLQELSGGLCAELTAPERTNAEALFSWGIALGTPLTRAAAESRKTQMLRDARAMVGDWVAGEYRRFPDQGTLNAFCRFHLGAFRTIRDAAETQLEDIEFELRGSVTPRAQR